ncbi:MAG: hypothetical protein H0V17_31955 [Deltaproteobacteria bacterium]|nr:hypothetical protein [Deltaproteobacteria bacterium]
MAALVLGGGAVAVTQLRGGASTPDAALLAQLPDAIVVTPAFADASEPDVAIEPADAAAALDAAVARRDAAVAKRDVGITLAPPDAAVALVPDAAELTVPDVPAAEDAKIVISNDTWCDVSVDGAAKGRVSTAGAKLIVSLPAGHHVITCTQPGINGASWTREVDLVGGKTVGIQGTLLATVAVTIAITTGDRVQLNGMHYPRGSVAKLKPARYRGVVYAGANPGIGGFVDITRVPCRLHEVGQALVCDP